MAAAARSSWTRNAAEIADVLAGSVDKAVADIPSVATELHTLVAEHPLALDIDPQKGRIIRATEEFAAGDEVFRETGICVWVHDSLGEKRTMRELQDTLTFTGRWVINPYAGLVTLLQLSANGTTVHPTDEYLAGVMASDAKRPADQRVSALAFVVHRIAKCNKYGVDLSDDEARRDWEAGSGAEIPHPYNPHRWVGALFMVLCMVNHDCNPNTVVEVRWDPEQHAPVTVVHALRDIHPGDEITVSYVEVSLPLAERQNLFKTEYKFVCKCERCRAEFLESTGATVSGAAGHNGDPAATGSAQ